MVGLLPDPLSRRHVPKSCNNVYGRPYSQPIRRESAFTRKSLFFFVMISPKKCAATAFANPLRMTATWIFQAMWVAPLFFLLFCVSINHQVVKTLVDQAYLSPLPIHTSPVYWEFEHVCELLIFILFFGFNLFFFWSRLYVCCLSLMCLCWPTNVTLIHWLMRLVLFGWTFFFGDGGKSLCVQGCTTFNPGPFCTNDFSFLVYYPSKLRSSDADEFEHRVEFSKIE